MEEIEEWFGGYKDFATGLILYQKYGPFQSVYHTLRNLGENQLTNKTLQEHLRRTLDKSKSVTVTANYQSVTSPLPAQTSFDASEIRKKANKLYSEMGALHSRLLAIKTVDERRGVMVRFHQLHKEWCAMMHRVEYFEMHGKEPPINPLKGTLKKTTAAGDAYKELIALRSKVSRAERDQIPKYMAEKNEKKLKKRTAELEQWKKRIAELENPTDGPEAN